MTDLAAATYMLAAALLFIAGILVLGVGCWVFARALAEAYRAKAHGIAAQVQQQTADATQDALDELQSRRRQPDYEMPPDEDLREFARAAARDEEPYRGDITTLGNDHDETPPITPDSFYVRDEVEA